MKLLVAIDFSKTTEKIIQFIGEMSAGTKHEAYLIHVVPPDPDFIGYKIGPESEREFVARKFHEKHIQLQEIAKEMQTSGMKVTPLLIQGPTIHTILREADKLKSDLIICGSHGHSPMKHLLMGSVSKGLVKHTRIPIMLVPSLDLTD